MRTRDVSAASEMVSCEKYFDQCGTTKASKSIAQRLCIHDDFHDTPAPLNIFMLDVDVLHPHVHPKHTHVRAVYNS